MAEEATKAPSKKERKAKAPAAPVEAPVAPAPEAKAPDEKKGGSTRNMYHFMGEAWKDPSSDAMKQLMWQRLVDWRKEGTFVRGDKPLRIDRARAARYKGEK